MSFFSTEIVIRSRECLFYYMAELYGFVLEINMHMLFRLFTQAECIFCQIFKYELLIFVLLYIL